jgi:hypothetical protein
MDSELNDPNALENEGRIASLLRQLGHAEREEDREPLAAELRDLTGQNFGTHLGKWLAWYLEDHLGMRNVLSVLSGKTGSNGDEEDPDESMSRSALEEEQVFESAEYNWCALERIKNKDDMVKLRRLYRDLESPIQTRVEGPFGFARLTGQDAESLDFFEGKSISQVLFHEMVQVRHLRVLKDYGKMMMMPVFPSATQRTGAIVYASAISQSLVRFDTKITSLSYKDLTESLPGLLERPYMVESYTRLFREALEKCS